MTPYDKLSDRDIDALVAELVMGICIHDWDKRIIPACVKCGADFMKAKHHSNEKYSTDDNAARLVRDRIAEMDIVGWFMRSLVSTLMATGTRVMQGFQLLNCSPRQQCIAALMALDSQTIGRVSLSTRDATAKAEVAPDPQDGK